MIVLDTCAFIYDALTPDRLSRPARNAIEHADSAGQLACCDISLWEVAMLVDRGRIDAGTDVARFLHLALTARSLRVLPITPEIAALSISLGLHGDPADRLIAATTVHHGATLVTSDHRLRDAHHVPTLW
jgi:PIN domain nuclease of toxin-antitoxin system